MADRLDIQKTYKMYVGGAFIRSESGHYYPLTGKGGKLTANICLATRKDFRDAVTKARGAQEKWAGRSAYNRGQILYRIAEMMEGRKDQFIAELVREGLTKKQAEKETLATIDRVVYFAGWTDKYTQLFSTVNPVQSSHFNFSLPEPMGVVVVMAPEKPSLLGLVSSILPAIVGGNTVIALASTGAPLSALTFSEILHSSDVPGGVINILTGKTEDLAEHFSTHMDVNAVVYAREDESMLHQIQENATGNLKRVYHVWYKDWYSDEVDNPYAIADLQETKTTWHPVGI